MARYYKQGVGKWYTTYKRSSCNNLFLLQKDFAIFLLLLFQYKRAYQPEISDYFTSSRFDKLHKSFFG